tara:strand:+ start:56 stop:532 length:477 start_codon:yes stop_codon:yes gene_type:complete
MLIFVRIELDNLSTSKSKPISYTSKMDLKILRLASNTKNQKKISDFTHNPKAKNPLCGDEIQLFFKLNKGKITDISYQGKNCVYCQASANLLSSNSNGKSVEEMIEVCNCANEFFKKKVDLSKNLQKYKELLSSKNINRKECILLPFNALKKALLNGN